MSSMPAVQLPEPSDAFNQSAIDTSPQIERFSFTGSGSEYFRIWIVNLLLTILTLGIYSAWAKVRRMRYFYDSTRLAGSSFEYHGNPIAILKGRIIAVVLIGGYNVAANFSLPLALALLAAFVLLTPWLAWKSLQFKLFNSSYRGIRFGFRGSLGQTYKVFLLYPILSIFTLYLLVPFAHQRLKRFQHNESRFGSSFFSFHAGVGSFYKTYLIGFLIAVAGTIVLGIVFGGTAAGIIQAGGLKEAAPEVIAALGFFMLAVFFWIFLLAPIFMTMIQKLIWNHTQLGEHKFSTDMKWTKLAFIMITNLIGIVLTLGLFTPFAKVRTMRYRIETMSVTTAGSLDNFVADVQADVSATGEGMADLLDFDLSL